jgi:uncharacterized protein (DUF1810 family)
MDDPFDLQRYLDAQAQVYERVCAELRSGRKTSHWMWFVFPQIHGLGSSPMSRRFAISSAREANAYLDHAILGARLQECCRILMQTEDRSAHDIFGSPDDLKLHSSMTLFANVAVQNRSFTDMLGKYFHGGLDRATLERL